MMFAGGVSPPYMCDSPSQLSCGERSPIMSQASPTGPNDPFLVNGMYSDSEASPNPQQVKYPVRFQLFIKSPNPCKEFLRKFYTTLYFKHFDWLA